MTVSVVDAHHHLLSPARFDYPFLPFLPELQREVGREELADHLRTAGVDYTVLVQAHDSEAETAFMLEEAAAAPWIAGVVGWVPLSDPDSTSAVIGRHRGEGTLLRGVRHMIHDEPDPDWVIRPQVIESLGVLAEHDLSFDVSAFSPAHIAHIPTIADLVPDLRMVLCHFGMPRAAESMDPAWVDAFEAAAACASCALKISGLDMFTGGVAVDLFRPYFEAAVEHFGPYRMIWASNWPVSLRGAGYAETLIGARELLADLSDDEQAAVFGGTADRIYRLGLDWVTEA